MIFFDSHKIETSPTEYINGSLHCLKIYHDGTDSTFIEYDIFRSLTYDMAGGIKAVAFNGSDVYMINNMNGLGLMMHQRICTTMQRLITNNSVTMCSQGYYSSFIQDSECL